MEILEEDTVCGPLCQHPTCWTSVRRRERNIPHRVVPLPKSKVKTVVNSARSLPEDLDEYDLPKQSVVNMLDDFGDDPDDKYPSKFKGRPMHERSKSIMSALEIQQSYNRTHTRESFHRGRAPQATPASLHPHSKIAAPRKKTSVGQVEVQEVFDFDELNKNWSETFKAKHYYVWVPNPKKKRKPHPPQEPPHHMQRGHKGNVRPKDITEDLVPQEIEWIREATLQFDDVWPVLKRKYQGRSAQSQSPYSRMQAYPVSEQLTPGREREPYYGIYELLDLPREVLNHVLQHVTERDLLDRQRFTQALMEALPQLEQKSTAIALAKSEVLQQRPMEILDGRLKEGSRQNEFPATQVFRLDNVEHGEQVVESSSHIVHAAPVRDSVTGIQAEVDEDQLTPRRLSKLNPVPPIGKSFDDVRDSKNKIPTISLGLPTIPSGVQHTKPFKYKGVDFDFSLGPVTTPESHEDKESTQRSDRDSTLHVTVPSVPSTEEETATEESGAITTATQPGPPMNTPLHTPATFYDGVSESPSPTKAGQRVPRELSFPSPLGHHPYPPVNTPQGPPVTEFTATDLQAPSTLDPIRETEQAPGTPVVDQGPPPRSGKSVRFAPNVVQETPSVPPSTPEPVEKQEAIDLSEVTTVKTVEGSLSVQANTVMAGPEPGTGAVSSKSQRSEDQSVPPSRGFSKQSSAMSTSPEPWPQINESEYNISPSPPPKSAQTRATSNREDQSMAVNLDSQETTPISSVILPRSGPQSRESNRSILKSRESQPGHMGGSKTLDDSPAPPPPSPEPKEGAGLAKENTGLSHLEDILETESEFTISARPPSNLDDDSAIPTPIISAKVIRKTSNNKAPHQLHKLGKEKSGDSLRRAMATSGLVKENTTTTVPSDSITVASEGHVSDKQDMAGEDYHQQWSPQDNFSLRRSAGRSPYNTPPTDIFGNAAARPNSVEPSSDLVVMGTKMDVAGKGGRALNMSRPDETRKRPLVAMTTPQNTPRGADGNVAVRNEDPESLGESPGYVHRGDLDTFDATEKEFHDELTLAYKKLSDLSDKDINKD